MKACFKLLWCVASAMAWYVALHSWQYFYVTHVMPMPQVAQQAQTVQVTPAYLTLSSGDSAEVHEIDLKDRSASFPYALKLYFRPVYYYAPTLGIYQNARKSPILIVPYEEDGTQKVLHVTLKNLEYGIIKEDIPQLAKVP